MRRIEGILVAATALAGVGCANPFGANYVSLEDVEVVAHEEEPRLVRGETDARMRARLTAENYVQIGVASFVDTACEESAALEQAKAVGAALVVLSRTHHGTLQGRVPLLTPLPQTHASGGFASTSFLSPSTPASGTSHVPYTVEQFDYTATFWARSRRPRPAP
ncbi:MAG TPA: hypothetical protein VEJ18_15820 [Planctomycetota bacterium]|nr:hypothetical protein [Planctomycetota bacterium]